jgi:hypothetical protein
MRNRLIAWSATFLTLVIAAVAVVGIWSAIASRGLPALADVAPWATRLASYPSGLAIVAVGWLLVTRFPTRGYGWAWLGLGFAQLVQMACRDYGILLLVSGDTGVMSPGLLGLLGDYGFLCSLWLIGLVLLLFPDGRLSSRLWRVVAWTSSVGVGLMAAGTWMLPGESGTLPASWPGLLEGTTAQALEAVGGVLLYVLFAAVPLGVLSVVLRYRRASGVGRQQIKWLALAALLSLPAWAIDLPGILDPIYEALSGVFLPLAMAVAIFRYRLYDIDRLISRTVSYGLLAAVLAAVYAGGVSALGAVVGSDNPLAVAGATLAAAAFFTPVRRRVQEWVDRRFDRTRYDTAQVVSAFSGRLRGEIDLEGLTTDLSAVVGATLRPATVSLVLVGQEVR